ncbi:hypothetical protein BN946_scf184938.g61 [Trametes cinnabarina]|uniref:Uncharacterized protein n=1 Tax=Pycnoporus cinnabarinus TaxID=5643 RepID=A0A060S7E0_PYCCI|nr:hypothetical protein BN946_scf184938.g61 [Trametes cinnabarina]
MRFTFLALAAAALSQSTVIVATPLTAVATDIAAKFPVFDIDKVHAQPNVTLSQGGIRVDTAQAEFPATLLLCPTTNCISCFGFDLSSMPTHECIVPGFTFQSVSINQPSNQGLPFGVFVGPGGCVSFASLPAVNTCYNVIPAPFSDYSVT